jgi:hypothetical protein
MVNILAGMSKLQIVIQVVAAFAIIVVLYIITLVVLNIDSIIVNNSVKVEPMQRTQIINGYASASYLNTQFYNTINNFTDNFKRIGRSINTRGGAQYSYQFWIKIDDTQDDEYFKDLILLLKGDSRQFKLAKYQIPTGSINNYPLINTYDPEYLINCPMIKFGASYREIQVFFNTSKGPAPITSAVTQQKSTGNSLIPNITIQTSPTDDIASRRNLLSLLPLNWYLFTFVFEDNYSLQDGSENGIKFTFYLNDFPYQINTAATDMFLRNNMLKQNDGDLFLLPNLKQDPTKGIEPLKLGNITYYNYAVDDKAVSSVFKMGPPTYSAIPNDSNSKQPSFLSAYNRIDLGNY